ncbi:unnamed protein product [Vitrella brassicaformis CCMP3155]|uniref:Uncharacterized protein n=1 Tax=Vitrella brassicaformis (strain CCMP3155) TaxID=1169540 RepID=A0A0G4H2I6_VITBC|nr:unnamed protein product [Vitrella brassicaformis CCMP3155]|eukprot:CEM37840.1 unnamed protein product [Vitrella brassicaformis CCMP3155]
MMSDTGGVAADQQQQQQQGRVALVSPRRQHGKIKTNLLNLNYTFKVLGAGNACDFVLLKNDDHPYDIRFAIVASHDINVGNVEKNIARVTSPEMCRGTNASYVLCLLSASEFHTFQTALAETPLAKLPNPIPVRDEHDATQRMLSLASPAPLLPSVIRDIPPSQSVLQHLLDGHLSSGALVCRFLSHIGGLRAIDIDSLLHLGSLQTIAQSSARETLINKTALDSDKAKKVETFMGSIPFIDDTEDSQEQQQQQQPHDGMNT